MDWYLPLKLVHIVSAIVAVGTNLTYFVWLTVMKSRPQAEQSFILATIRGVDARLANPGYFLLPITGIAMVLIGDIGFTTFWIAVAIGLYILVAVLAGAVFVPALRRLTTIVETEGPGSNDYPEAVKQTRTRGLLTMLPIAGILYLMVLKPTP